jgi:mutator protein MutT
VSNRRYPEHPLLGVGALIFHENRILLVERGKDPHKGFWSLPGGAVEVGETLEEAVRREVREETAIEIKIIAVIEIFERIIRDGDGRPEYHYVLIDYLCRAVTFEACAGTDAAGVAWVRREDLHRYQITEGSLPVIEKAFDAALRK